MTQNGFQWGQIRLHIAMAFHMYEREHIDGERDVHSLWNVGHLIKPNMILTPDVSVTDVTDVERNGLYVPIPPTIAIEVATRFLTASLLQTKTTLYLEAGSRQVWHVFPETQTIVIWEGRTATAYDGDATIYIEHLFPNFALALSDVFKSHS